MKQFAARRKKNLGTSSEYIPDYMLGQEQRALLQREDAGFLQEYALTTASTFVTPEDMERQKHLTTFIKTMGMEWDADGMVATPFTEAGARLGIFNKDDSSKYATVGLYDQDKAYMLYNEIAAYDSNEIMAHIRSTYTTGKDGQPTRAQFDLHAIEVGKLLDANTELHDNTMLDKLNLTAKYLQSVQLVDADNLAGIEKAGDIQLMRSTLYQADPEGYESTYTSRGKGDEFSLANTLYKSGGNLYDDYIDQVVGTDSNYSPQVQALNYKLGKLEMKRKAAMGDGYKTITEGVSGDLENLHKKSSWKDAASGTAYK
jgi:hypothetical protein